MRDFSALTSPVRGPATTFRSNSALQGSLSGRTLRSLNGCFYTAPERLTREHDVAETKYQAFVYGKITPQSATVIMITTTIGKNTSNT